MSISDEELERQWASVNNLLAGKPTSRSREAEALKAIRKRLLPLIRLKDLRDTIAQLEARGRTESAEVVRRELRRAMGEDVRDPVRVKAGLASAASKTPEQRKRDASRAGTAAWTRRSKSRE